MRKQSAPSIGRESIKNVRKFRVSGVCIWDVPQSAVLSHAKNTCRPKRKTIIGLTRDCVDDRAEGEAERVRTVVAFDARARRRREITTAFPLPDRNISYGYNLRLRGSVERMRSESDTVRRGGSGFIERNQRAGINKTLRLPRGTAIRKPSLINNNSPGETLMGRYNNLLEISIRTSMGSNIVFTSGRPVADVAVQLNKTRILFTRFGRSSSGITARVTSLRRSFHSNLAERRTLASLCL